MQQISKTTLFWYAIGTFFSMVVARFVLEYLLEPNGIVSGFGGFPYLIQYTLYYAVIFVGFAGIVGYFHRVSFSDAWQTSVRWSWVILVPPIVNKLVGIISGTMPCSSYVADSGVGLIVSFLSMGLISNFSCGISPGILVGILLLAFGVFQSIQHVGVQPAITGTFLVIVLGFSQGAVLGILGSFSELVRSGVSSATWISEMVIPQSLLATVQQFGIITQGDWITSWSLYFARFHFLSLVIVLLFSVWVTNRPFFLAVFRSFQYSRIVLYGVLMVFGMKLGGYSFSNMFSNNADVMGLLVVLLSFFCVGVAVTVMNDIVDQSIDTISNPERPIPSGVSPAVYQSFGVGMGLLGMVGALLINFPVFLWMMFGGGIVILYSVPPFRLRMTIVGTWISGVLAGISQVFVGYYFVSENVLPSLETVLTIIGITVFFGWILLFKDFKDISGDRANNVQTLPTWLGIQKAKYVLIALLVIGYIDMGLLFGTIITSVVAMGVSIYVLITKTVGFEKYIFGIWCLWLLGIVIK